MPKSVESLIKVLKTVPPAARVWVVIVAILVAGGVTAWGHTTSLDDIDKRVTANAVGVAEAKAKADSALLANTETRGEVKTTREILTIMQGQLNRIEERLLARDEGSRP